MEEATTKNQIWEMLLHQGHLIDNIKVSRGQVKGIDTISVRTEFIFNQKHYFIETDFAEKNKLTGYDMGSIINSQIKKENLGG